METKNGCSEFRNSREDKKKLDSFGQALRMTWGKGVNVFSLSKGEGQGEGFITNLRKELINLSTYPHINFRKAFTLAEVLITLGIIGIVAAMTIPALMTKYQKQRTETQLVKFYSMMNQTLRMSVADNGDPDGWVVANKNYTYDENVEFLKTYIFPYMKHLGYKQWPDQESNNNKLKVVTTLIDGSVMTFRITQDGGDISYYIDEKWLTDTTNIQRHRFNFQFAKKADVGPTNINSLNYIEPYMFRWDGTREGLINSSIYGCNKNSSYPYVFCTKLIQMNSWKIPSDYPW